MGIRYEKDTILNWINEMGKFLRLLVDKRAGVEDLLPQDFNLAAGYLDFFGKDKRFFLAASDDELLAFVATLDAAQVRPLALLLMHDGFLSQDRGLLAKAKFLLEHHMQSTGAFSFEDYAYLADLAKEYDRLS